MRTLAVGLSLIVCGSSTRGNSLATGDKTSHPSAPYLTSTLALRSSWRTACQNVADVMSKSRSAYAREPQRSYGTEPGRPPLPTDKWSIGQIVVPDARPSIANASFGERPLVWRSSGVIFTTWSIDTG